MSIKIFSAKKYGNPLKVTIQKTGRLGFTDATAKYMYLGSNTYFLFGKDDKNPDCLVMVKVNAADENAFRVIKCGNYYYLPTTALFDALGYNYKNGLIIFDVKRDASLDEESGGDTYLLRSRKAKTRHSRG